MANWDLQDGEMNVTFDSAINVAANVISKGIAKLNFEHVDGSCAHTTITNQIVMKGGIVDAVKRSDDSTTTLLFRYGPGNNQHLSVEFETDSSSLDIDAHLIRHPDQLKVGSAMANGAIFAWDSYAIGDHYPGKVVIFARSVEEARDKILKKAALGCVSNIEQLKIDLTAEPEVGYIFFASGCG